MVATPTIAKRNLNWPLDQSIIIHCEQWAHNTQFVHDLVTLPSVPNDVRNLPSHVNTEIQLLPNSDTYTIIILNINADDAGGVL